MSDTDLQFFTNENGRELANRFERIFKKTKYFDALVGYFRTSGFFKMYSSLEAVKHIRILVGLNVDKFTIDLIDKAKEEILYREISAKEGFEFLSQNIRKEYEESEETSNVKKGAQKFIDWLLSGKLEIKMYTKRPTHAKVYIMREQDDSPDFGRLITGSSNFSTNGLSGNLEFNVELKDNSDVKFALEKFEELWADGVDVTEAFVDKTTRKPKLPILNEETPYHIYLKTLYEYFKDQLDLEDKKGEQVGQIHIPEGKLKLQYQLDAVEQAYAKLEAYNGVFISDVVGLGKTYISSMLAQKFPIDAWKLIICPPHLIKNWEEVLSEYFVTRYKVESLGKLDSILKEGVEKYKYVFIDEAHRFRNDNTDFYTQLHQICQDKKVILISATPFNNYTADIENQIYLFQSKRNGTINGIKNLEGFFADFKTKLGKLERGSPKYYSQLRQNSETIRERLLREIMIRRTRNDIMSQKRYLEDLKKEGKTFPKVGRPHPLGYVLNRKIDVVYENTLKIIQDKEQFTYSRYKPLTYLDLDPKSKKFTPEEIKLYKQMQTPQENMGGFMKGLLVKRLESSFYAFKQTLSRFAISYENFIKMVQNGTVFIGKKIDVSRLVDDDTDKTLTEYLEREDLMCFKSDQFKTDFMDDLNTDLETLKKLQKMWDDIEDDPKLESFKNYLNTNFSEVLSSVETKKLSKKIIVFTESSETAEYLYSELKNFYKDRIIYYTSEKGRNGRDDIQDSFDQDHIQRQNDKYDFLITTDVLSEGINLHRSNVLINYDLPWNPTRIIQRVGRVNRVGTTHDRIFVFNYFPTSQSNKEVALEDRIVEKLQVFHDILGEDMQYLTDCEVTGSKGLYSILTPDLDNEGDDINPEIEYLNLIRDVRDQNPELFETIKAMPLKSKAGKKGTEEGAISFIKKGELKTFFYSSEKGTEQKVFAEAMKILKTEPDEKAISVGEKYFDFFKQNSEEFDLFLQEENIAKADKPKVMGNDAMALKILKAIANKNFLSDVESLQLKNLIQKIENGELPSNIFKNISTKLGSVSEENLFKKIKEIVPENYMMTSSQRRAKEFDSNKQVILTCYMNNQE